jgi:preprotein translocase subunit SecG
MNQDDNTNIIIIIIIIIIIHVLFQQPEGQLLKQHIDKTYNVKYYVYITNNIIQKEIQNKKWK